ncbi:MAG: dTDP-glucose 4,6-dehydratase [Solirubrobacteraceae bacterium]
MTIEAPSALPDGLIARLRGARILVLGGAGFIGSHLVDGLLAAGVSRVAVADDLSLGREENLTAALHDERCTLDVIDACDQGALQALVDRDGRYDLCFNLAVIPLPHSLEHPRENVDRNIAMTTAICEIGRSDGFRRLVQFSSSEVYGTARVAPITEDHPLGAHTPYAASKAGADLVALSYGTTFQQEVIVVRPFNTYGERQNDATYAGLIPIVVRRAQAGEPVVIDGDGEQTRDMTHVSDTVRGTLALAAAYDLQGQAFNLGHGSEVSVNQMVRSLLDAMDLPDHPVVHGPERPGDVRRLLADVTAARDAVGFQALVELDEGFRRTVRWYLDQTS